MLKSKLNNKKLIVGSYVCLFLIMELFHSFIGIYFDDYGNASLSYGYHADVVGMNWTLEDLGQWAHWIYFNFSGRIMCGSILNLLFKIGGGQHLFMAIQAGILTLMFYMMYRLVMYYTGQKDNVWIAVMVVALFFIMPPDMYRWNLCWASASVLYIWPLLPFFAVVYLQFLLRQEELASWRKALYNVICIIGILFTAFSHEQTGLSIAGYLVIVCVYQCIVQKQFVVRDGIYAILGVGTYCALFFAPGNWNRLDGNTEFAELSFFEKIAHNYEPLMGCLFPVSFIVLYGVITVILLFFAYRKYKNEQKRLPLVLNTIALILLAGATVGSIVKITVVALVCETGYLITVFVSLILYNVDRDRIYVTFLLIASALSAFCVLISPTLPMRCFTEWILVIHIVLLICCYDFWREFLHEKNRRLYVCWVVLYVVTCIYAAKTFGGYAIGYCANKGALEYNEEQLQNLSETDNKVYLYKLPNDFFAPTMPYAEGQEYIEYWMKEYYGISNDVEFIWTKNNMVSYDIQGEFYEDGWFGKEGVISTTKECWAKQIILNCHVPEGQVDVQDITIVTNGKETKYHLVEGDNQIILSIKFGKKNQIKILAEQAKILSKDDERELSFLISYYFK